MIELLGGGAGPNAPAAGDAGDAEDADVPPQEGLSERLVRSWRLYGSYLDSGSGQEVSWHGRRAHPMGSNGMSRKRTAWQAFAGTLRGFLIIPSAAYGATLTRFGPNRPWPYFVMALLQLSILLTAATGIV